MVPTLKLNGAGNIENGGLTGLLGIYGFVGQNLDYNSKVFHGLEIVYTLPDMRDAITTNLYLDLEKGGSIDLSAPTVPKFLKAKSEYTPLLYTNKKHWTTKDQCMQTKRGHDIESTRLLKLGRENLSTITIAFDGFTCNKNYFNKDSSPTNPKLDKFYHYSGYTCDWLQDEDGEPLQFLAPCISWKLAMNCTVDQSTENDDGEDPEIKRMREQFSTSTRFDDDDIDNDDAW
jgi:hypothetical protein